MLVSRVMGALAQSEAEYRKLANALPQIIWTCDAEGRLEWVNDRWTELTGLSAEESLSDKGALVRRAPRRSARAPAALRRRASRPASPCEMEYRIRTREGAYRFHLCRVVPVRDDARRHHALGGGRLRHARSPPGRGGAARVGAQVRDGLSPQSAADGHHPPLRRRLPERQRRVPAG